MSLCDSRHSTQRHAAETDMSYHVTSHHKRSNRTTEHSITSYQITYRRTLDADAADTQPVTSLTYQLEIPQDIT